MVIKERGSATSAENRSGCIAVQLFGRPVGALGVGFLDLGDDG